MTPVGKPARRGEHLAAAIIGLSGLATLWFGAVVPVQAWFAARQNLLEQHQQQLVRMRDLGNTLPMLQAVSAAQRDHAMKGASVMLPGGSDAIAAAFLQQQVQTLAVNAGVSLTAVETLPSTTVAGRWHRIALRVSLDAPWPVLISLIRSVEQLTTRTMIDDIHLRNAIAANPSAETLIQASMTLYGLIPADTARSHVAELQNHNS